MIEKMAKLLFPDGIELGFGGNSEEAARQTMRTPGARDGTFFEATFISGHRLAPTDIPATSLCTSRVAGFEPPATGWF